MEDVTEWKDLVRWQKDITAPLPFTSLGNQPFQPRRGRIIVPETPRLPFILTIFNWLLQQKEGKKMREVCFRPLCRVDVDRLWE